MKSHVFILVALVASTLAQAQDKAAQRAIGAAFDQIEAEHKDWPHYSYSAENLEGGQSYQHHVWKSDGDNGFVKVESLNFDDHGESKVQFFFKGSDLLFTLDRSEQSHIEPKNYNSVVERRYYFANNQLIRLLEKKGDFPAGQPTDTTALKNKELPIESDENANETYITQHEIAADVIERARRLDGDAAPAEEPAAAPAAGASSAGYTQVGEGWRVIAGSTSKDGTYSLAWGIKGQSAVDDAEVAEDGSLAAAEDDKNLVNFVVNVRTGQIIGSIAGKHFADKSSISNATSETAWYSSMYVAQVNSGKWATWDASVYAVSDAAVSKPTDLLAPTKKAVNEHLADSDLFKKFDKDDFTLSLHDVCIVQRGGAQGAATVVVEVNGMIPKSEEEGSNFEATVTFTLTGDDNGGPPVLRWSSTERHKD